MNCISGVRMPLVLFVYILTEKIKNSHSLDQIFLHICSVVYLYFSKAWCYLLLSSTFLLIWETVQKCTEPSLKKDIFRYYFLSSIVPFYFTGLSLMVSHTFTKNVDKRNAKLTILSYLKNVHVYMLYCKLYKFW